MDTASKGTQTRRFEQVEKGKPHTRGPKYFEVTPSPSRTPPPLTKGSGPNLQHKKLTQTYPPHK